MAIMAILDKNADYGHMKYFFKEKKEKKEKLTFPPLPKLKLLKLPLKIKIPFSVIDKKLRN